MCGVAHLLIYSSPGLSHSLQIGQFAAAPSSVSNTSYSQQIHLNFPNTTRCELGEGHTVYWTVFDLRWLC